MEDPVSHKLRVREKIGFSLGDLAYAFVFQTVVIFQAGFYTDVMGISAAALGALLFFVRISDAITDPIMGVLADRTTHRWGKFRPWLLWATLPLVGLFWLAFTVPSGASDSFRLGYAFVTYGLLMVAYTASNVPYGALNAVLTGDTHERTSLSSYRYFAIMVGALVVQGLTLPLVGKLGSGNDARGWSLTTAIYGVIAVALLVVTFLSTKERIHPPPEQKENFRQDFRDMLRNGPWIALFVMGICQFTMMALRGGASYYYFTYFVDTEALNHFIGHFGLFATATQTAEGSGGLLFIVLDALGLIVHEGGDPSKVGFGLFNVVGALFSMAGVFFALPLARRFGKKRVYILGLALATLAQVSFLFLPPNSVGLMFFFFALASLLTAPTAPISWAMQADAVDYSEWKNGRRATGFLYAALGFGIKVGMGLGGALIGLILAAYGYTVEAAEAGDAQVLHGITLSMSLYSALPMLVGILAMLFYPLTRARNRQMLAELAARRAAAEDATSVTFPALPSS